LILNKRKIFYENALHFAAVRPLKNKKKGVIFSRFKFYLNNADLDYFLNYLYEHVEMSISKHICRLGGSTLSKVKILIRCGGRKASVITFDCSMPIPKIISWKCKKESVLYPFYKEWLNLRERGLDGSVDVPGYYGFKQEKRRLPLPNREKVMERKVGLSYTEYKPTLPRDDDYFKKRKMMEELVQSETFPLNHIKLPMFYAYIFIHNPDIPNIFGGVTSARFNIL